MADLPPLVDPTDLDGFDGAPFPPSVVRAAASSVRRLCGWHIAPEVTASMVLDHDGGHVLMLSSLHVTSVTAVRDLTGAEPRDLTGWRWSGAGMIEGSFPRGFRSVEVTFTHGYVECPPDLLPAIARGAARRVRQQSAGPFSVTYEAEAGEPVLDSYRLGARP